MKKTFAVFAFLSILSFLPLALAVQININPSFEQGETLTSQISGNFVNPLQAQNILLYNGHIRVPFIPYLVYENGVYYIYGQLSGKSPGNYSLVLSGISYFESGKTQTSDVSKKFTISNATADFSIEPGFVSVENGSRFFISAENLGGNSITINSSLSASGNSAGSSETKTLIGPGETKKIYFSSGNASSAELYASMSSPNTSYTIPVFVSSASSPAANPPSIFTLQPSELNVSLPTSSSSVRYVYVSNKGQNTINASISVSESVKPYIVILNNSLLVGPNATKKFELNIVSKDNNSLTYGSISVASGNATKTIAVLLNFSSSYVPPGNGSGNYSQSLFQTCAQIGGIKCNDTETCTGQTKTAQDGPCCLGACQSQTKGSSAGKAIGWSLVAIVVILLAVFFIRRYSKTKKRPANLLGFLKKKEK